MEISEIIESYQNYIVNCTMNDNPLEKDHLLNFRDAFTQCIQLKPLSSDAYYWRGLCNSELKNYREAFFDFNKAVELNKEDEYSSTMIETLNKRL